MNEDQLTDLKQFIAATVSQATANMATKEDLEDIKTDIARVEKKVDDLELKVDTISDTLNETLNEHESKLTKLEQRAA